MKKQVIVSAGDAITAEEWRPIVGFEGWYSVSNLGRIRRENGISNRTKPGFILKNFLNSQGYPRVDLHVNGRRYSRQVHQLVALTFIGPCPHGKEINHIDSNRDNPNLLNLEYVTRSENTLHAYRNGRGPDNKGSKSGMSKLKEEQVLKIRELYRSTDLTTRQLARIFNVHQSNISDIIRRNTWRHI